MMERGGLVGTQAGAVMAVFGGLTLNEMLAIGGFLLALASFVFQVGVTIYFKHQHLQLARARLSADLENRDGDDDDA
ncbi:MAG: hypothetical protein Q7U80_03240 [Thiobacillus sp.]|nr:hypothetical protein [Thiobacillus sp.]